jgi:hypothetical protein
VPRLVEVDFAAVGEIADIATYLELQAVRLGAPSGAAPRKVSLVAHRFSGTHRHRAVVVNLNDKAAAAAAEEPPP